MSEPPGRGALAPSPPRFSVVVADDMADLRHIARMALESSQRFEVVAEAADGREAVAKAAEHQPDLVLLDLAMPVLDGLQALPRIRQVAPGAKVVILSVFERGRLGPASLGGGAVGYLEKGILPSRLADELLAVAGFLDVVEDALDQALTTLAPGLDSPRSARQFMEATLTRWDCPDVLDTVKLLVSELVTNAVVHARSDVEVGVRLTPRTVRVEVTDHGSPLGAGGGALAPGQPDDEATSGRGLFLVEALSSSWGVEPREGGKTMWFEVPTPR